MRRGERSPKEGVGDIGLVAGQGPSEREKGAKEGKEKGERQNVHSFVEVRGNSPLKEKEIIGHFRGNIKCKRPNIGSITCSTSWPCVESSDDGNNSS